MSTRVETREKEKKREKGKRKIATYHNRQYSVDLPDVILVLIEDVDRDTGVLTAETAHATRLEGLHTAQIEAHPSRAAGNLARRNY